MPIVKVHCNVRVTAEEEAIFVSACAAGDIGLVGRLHGEGVTSPVALRVACLSGRLDVAAFLVDRGVVPTSSDMYAACRGGSLAAVKFLLMHGVAPCVDDMEAACRNGRLDVVEFLFLLRHGVDLSRGMTAACCNGRLDVVEFLFRRGADLSCGMTAACCNGRLDVVEFLLHRGADLSMTMTTACCNGRLDVVQFLVRVVVPRCGVCVREFANAGLLEIHSMCRVRVLDLYEKMISTVPVVGFLVQYADAVVIETLDERWIPLLRIAFVCLKEKWDAKFYDAFCYHRDIAYACARGG